MATDPIISPTAREVFQAQRDARNRARQLATNITGINQQSNANVREILPDQDLESGDDNGWNGTDNEWVQAGLTADQTNETYQIDSNAGAENKVLVFYGQANVASDVLTTEQQYQDTTGATFSRINVETLEITEVSDIILYDEEIVYGPTEDGSLVQWPDSAGDDQMIYLAKVAEPAGKTVTQRPPTEERLQ